MQPVYSQLQSRQVMRTLEIRGVHVRLEAGQLIGYMDSDPVPPDMETFLHHYEGLITTELQRHAGEPMLASPERHESSRLLEKLDAEQQRVERQALEVNRDLPSPSVLESIKRLEELDAQQARLVQKLAADAKSEPEPTASPMDASKIVSHVQERRLNERKPRRNLYRSVRSFISVGNIVGGVAVAAMVVVLATFIFMAVSLAITARGNLSDRNSPSQYSARPTETPSRQSSEWDDEPEHCEVVATGPYMEEVICD